ncbi:cupin domain-containing protein [Methylococcus capsulatus]|uniref:cupin domain-containing protein n=1 Tax=Methylococcus capsulatus TaxID=414 RepID=UPI001C52AE99|nr:cupin domain-containing protein [Methylococcus capsulatus]QXP87489.1 cupin domain-containing protein [Methylococcus capsulatus]UQN12498.1 cupin domain-containing protein [Methylococcus capsulatus]
MPKSDNLYSAIPAELPEELFDTLEQTDGFRLERIVSRGHTTPEGRWYDQPQAEWVILLQGEALLRFEQEAAPRRLVPGDWLRIPPRCRHRVEWTSSQPEAIWLALHYPEPVRTEALESE